MRLLTILIFFFSTGSTLAGKRMGATSTVYSFLDAITRNNLVQALYSADYVKLGSQKKHSHKALDLYEKFNKTDMKSIKLKLISQDEDLSSAIVRMTAPFQLDFELERQCHYDSGKVKSTRVPCQFRIISIHP